MKLRKLIPFLFLISLLAVTLSACSTKEKRILLHRVNIVTSTNIYADIAKNIVGKHGHVQAIIKTVIQIHMILSLRLALPKKWLMLILLLPTV